MAGNGRGPVRLALTGTATAVSDARRFVRERAAGLTRELVEAAELVVSEIATNALVHGGAPREVVFEVRPDGCWVAVEDASTQQPQPRLARVDAVDGRGLAIVSALAADWGFIPRRTGKQVWALLTPHSVTGSLSS